MKGELFYLEVLGPEGRSMFARTATGEAASLCIYLPLSAIRCSGPVVQRNERAGRHVLAPHWLTRRERFFDFVREKWSHVMANEADKIIALTGSPASAVTALLALMEEMRQQAGNLLLGGNHDDEHMVRTLLDDLTSPEKALRRRMPS